MRSLKSIALFGLLALAGCQSHPHVNAHIDTVNAEYRQLEDYVYCLEDEVARLQQQIDAQVAVRPAEPAAVPGAPRGGLFRSRPERLPRGGAAPAPSPDEPQIEVPGSSSLAPPSSAPQRIRPAGGEKPIAEAVAPKTPTDTKITHITLSPLFTGGADFDGHPGDEGLCIVLEPRNAAEEFVPEAGPISVVVLDPAREGDASRVARWDFDLSAARQKLANSATATGIKLELPWPATPPEANRLHLFVRYETSDGRKLQSDREVFLTPPGQISNRWTPRTAQRQRSAAAVAPASAESIATDSLPAPAPPPSLSSDESAPRAPRPTWSPHR